MAGGIEWFRWHHGSVTDPKFQLVARRSGASLPDVLAVWAYILERASASDARGEFGELDCEALDCLFGFPEAETRTANIIAEMGLRGLVEGEAVCSWDKRQPKREREDDSGTERSRKHREQHKKPGNTTSGDATPCNATQHHATPSNAIDAQKTPREEERRVEEDISASAEIARTGAGDACKAMRKAGMADVSPSHPTLLALLAGGITVAELVGAATDAVAKRKGFAYALAVAEGRRRDASAVGQLPEARGSPTETVYQRSMREKMAQWAPGIAAKAPDFSQPFIDLEPGNVTAIESR